MGLSIQKTRFKDTDYSDFKIKLHENLNELSKLLKNPDFGVGDITIGAEIELSIIDNLYQPKLINQKIVKKAKTPQLQHELNKYNLELNLNPVNAEGNGFEKLGLETAQCMADVNKICEKYDSSISAIGILPTLKDQHFTSDVMTDVPRYHALTNGIKSLRNGPFLIDINGIESLKRTTHELAPEGANTSFQVQLKVPPKEYADMYNAIQLVTPLALAVSANSPIIMNKLLWDETRIALFKQSIDCRKIEPKKWRVPNRVSFGYGWVREGALEIFAENVALFEPLLPQLQKEPTKINNNGPELFEMRLHQGAIWHWNRAIYDPIDGGHLRIEMRALPSGPTIDDMVANAAFMIGLSTYLRDEIKTILPQFPFMFAEYNFYTAAKMGLRSELLWPLKNNEYNKSHTVSEIVNHVLPMASEGLLRLKVDEELIKKYMNIIRNRVEANQNGASWQQLMVRKYEKFSDREEAIKQMFAEYMLNSNSGKPVSEWSTK
jgi:gamma-glutamyl:cysteine ligase YbdK (ATP-grasp superfamily)